MIDGGVIANNPSLISYQFATKLLRKGPLRVFSLGTGVGPAREYDIDGWNRIDYAKMAAELVVDIDVFVSDYIVKQALKAQAKKIENDQLSQGGQ